MKVLSYVGSICCVDNSNSLIEVSEIDWNILYRSVDNGEDVNGGLLFD